MEESRSILPVPSLEGDDPDVCVPDPAHVSAQLSKLVAEMVRAKDLGVARSSEARLGGLLGRFRLVRELGRGSFGVVYEAEDRELGRPVALKLVRPRLRMASRGIRWLLGEAEAMGRLDHPHIVRLLDFGRGACGPYLVFELLRGRSLAERLRAGLLPLEQTLQVGMAVSRALVHAHAAGVVHRDLTASNVHLGDDGSVKVLDFGLAHLFGCHRGREGGTPAYMAPEQWEGQPADAKADLFALGVILFQALAGEYPYKFDKGWTEALEPGETPPLPAPSAPRLLRRLVELLIDRSPERRPQTARAVRDQLLAMQRAHGAVGR